VRRQLRTYVKSSAGNYNINTEGLRNIEIPMPNKTTQDSFLYNRKLIEQSCLKVIKRDKFLDLFKKELIGRFL
ncbi:MAG: hypothetical protein SCM96_16080, partial [Acidobacteriota bacterium]|nr:hypothetical protein [Acidobacteriota bacterium]